LGQDQLVRAANSDSIKNTQPAERLIRPKQPSAGRRPADVAAGKKVAWPARLEM
jgi:hypothetical protein